MKLTRYNSATTKPITLSAVIAATLTTLSGCGGSSSSDTPDHAGDNRPFSEVIVDASSYSNYTYFNLDTGKTVDLTAEAAKSDTSWHIGFLRDKIILNGGASGAGKVSAALVAGQGDFYDSEDHAVANVFLNASKDSEEEHLLAQVDTSSLVYQQDRTAAAIQGTGDLVGNLIDQGWYYYNPATHSLSANPNNSWLIRSGEGNSYARFHTESLEYDRLTGLTVSFALDIQSADTDQFASSGLFTTTIPATGGSSCFDFDTNTAVDCTNEAWDMKLEIKGREWTIWTNGGVSGGGEGGAFGPFTTEEASVYTSGHLSPAGTSFDSHYTQDRSAGVFLVPGLPDRHGFNQPGCQSVPVTDYQLLLGCGCQWPSEYSLYPEPVNPSGKNPYP